jgi:hypothetical protein
MKTIATGYLDGVMVNIVRISHENSRTVIELDNGATDLLDYVDRLQFIID